MKIGKPNYSLVEILEQFENMPFASNVEKQITLCLLKILEDSTFYLFNDNYKHYVSDMEFEKEPLSSFGNIPSNVSVEFFDTSLEFDILINIIDSKNPLLKRLISILGENVSGDYKLLLFYYKDRDGYWNILVESICLKNNVEKRVEIFKKRSFGLKQSVISEEDATYLNSFFDEIKDIEKNIRKIISFKNMEFVHIPIPKNGKAYKIPHIFFREPNRKNLNREKYTKKLESNSLSFSRSIYKLKDKLFFK